MFIIATIHSQLVDQDYETYKAVRNACKAEHIASGKKQSTFEMKWHFVLLGLSTIYNYTKPVQLGSIHNEKAKAFRRQIREDSKAVEQLRLKKLGLL